MFVVCQFYSEPSAESYGVFDNHHAASSGDIYSQYNATHPYNHYNYNYDQDSSIQTTTNAAAGNYETDQNII